MNPFKEMLRDKDLKQVQFLKQNGKLLAKKEKLWAGQSAIHWGIKCTENICLADLYNDKDLAFSKMLWQETVEADKLRNEFAYLNFQAKAELAALLKTKQTEELAQFSEFSKGLSEEVTKVHVYFGDLLAELSQLQFD